MNTRNVVTVLAAVTLCGMVSAQPIAVITCSPRANSFMVEYITGSDDGFNELLEFPRSCKLGSTRYRIRAVRGPYTQSMCGAQPPVSIWITRNGSPLVVDTVFGDNCFRGPSIGKLSVTESTHGIASMEVCVLPEFMAEHMKCTAVPADQLSTITTHPITQATLDTYLRQQ